MILPVRCDGLLWASFPGVFGAGGQVWARGLGAAGGRVFWGGEDLGPVAAEGH
jgi:hypothetical protein